MSAYGPPSRKEAERMERVRAMTGQRMRNAGTPRGPDPGSGLEGRRGVADSVPQEQLTPEQFRERNMPRNNLEIPRLPSQGRVWDQGLDRGNGGYGERAPNQAEIDRTGPVPPPPVPLEIPRTGPRYIKEKRKPLTIGGNPNLKTWDLGPTESNNAGMMEYVRNATMSSGLESFEAMTGGKPMDLEGRARALGIDPSAYSPEARGQLEADVSALEDRHEQKLKNFDAKPVPGGGFRYTANAGMRAQMDRRQGDKTVETLWNRWHEQAGKTMIPDEDRPGERRPMTYADFAAAYYAGEGLTPTQRAANLQSMITPLKAQKRTEISDSIKQRAQQDNMARRMNTHVANIVFADTLQNAQTPEDTIRALISGQVQNPNLGLGNMAMMMQRGMDDLAAQKMMGDQARENASSSLPGARSRRDLDAIKQSGQTGPALIAELEQHAIRNQPQGVPSDPAIISSQVIANAGDHARSIAQKDPNSWSGEDKLFMSQLSRHYAAAAGKGKTVDDPQVYANWANSVGLNPGDYGTRKLWKMVTGGAGNIQEWGDWAPGSQAWGDWWNSGGQ